jgi:CheY-like chemotaxis protein
MVLMDVQMPEMDGFEATAAIRAGEQGTGAHIPLIAITAHAMRGDRERCLSAGFDGYVSKPVQFKELFDTIDRLTPPELGAKRRTPIPGGATPDPTAESPSAFDERVALERTGGDRELLRELIAVFLSEIPNWMQTLRGALERRDAPALRITAHAVKGAVDSCGASGAFDAAMLLERIGAEGNLAAAPAALAVLERRIERARADLGAYLSRNAASEGVVAGAGGAMLGSEQAGSGRA